MVQLPANLKKKLNHYLPKSKQSEFINQAVLVALEKFSKKTSQTQLPLSQKTTQTKQNNCLSVYSDGGARGNPGPAGCGALIFDKQQKKIWEKSKFIGKATNNEAEYHALLLAVKKIHSLQPQCVIFYLDSELIVKQMQGLYKVKKPALRTFYHKIKTLLIPLSNVQFQHIPRSKNQLADQLANQAMNQGNKKL